MLGPRSAAALYQSINNLLTSAADVLRVALANMLVLLFRSPIARISLYNRAFSAHRGSEKRSHRFAQAVREKPCRFQLNTKRPMQLVRRNALLAGAHKERRLEPQMQFKAAFFEDRSLAHCELLPAGVTQI